MFNYRQKGKMRRCANSFSLPHRRDARQVGPNSRPTRKLLTRTSKCPEEGALSVADSLVVVAVAGVVVSVEVHNHLLLLGSLLSSNVLLDGIAVVKEEGIRRVAREER